MYGSYCFCICIWTFCACACNYCFRKFMKKNSELIHWNAHAHWITVDTFDNRRICNFFILYSFLFFFFTKTCSDWNYKLILFYFFLLFYRTEVQLIEEPNEKSSEMSLVWDSRINMKKHIRRFCKMMRKNSFFLIVFFSHRMEAVKLVVILISL